MGRMSPPLAGGLLSTNKFSNCCLFMTYSIKWERGQNESAFRRADFFCFPPSEFSIAIVHGLFKYPMPSKQFIRRLSFKPDYCQSPYINKPKIDGWSGV